MQVNWPLKLGYGVFADPIEGWFDLISDRPPQDETVRTAFEPLGALVTTPAGEFQDLEISLAKFIPVSLELPHPYSAAVRPVSSHFEGGTAESYIDEEARTLLIRFESPAPDQWILLGASGVFLGLSAVGALRAIFCRNVILDPGCIQLDAWQEANGFYEGLAPGQQVVPAIAGPSHSGLPGSRESP